MLRKGIVHQVRMESNAGHYMGSIEFSEGEGQPYDRDSCYYPNEKMLQKEYPESKSLKEAFDEATHRRMYKVQ
jgi:hypothetical protein